MKNIKFSRLFAAMMFVAVLSFAGCKQQPEETPTIYGTWMSQYDEGYKITDTTIEYIDNFYGFGWEAELVEVADPYIYYKASGKYSAVAYKELSKDSCKFATAYKADGKSPVDTLEEAKTEFTIGNKYFEIYGTYGRVE